MAAGELTARTYTDATPAISVTRDELGQPFAATDSIGAHTFSWNKRGQITSANGPYGDLAYAYAPDHTFRTNLNIQVGGKTMTVAYTYAGARLASIAWRKTGDAAPMTFNYSYHPNSDLMSKIESGSGVVLRHEYDPQIDRLTAITATTVGGGPLASIEFLAYTPQDKVKKVHYSIGEELEFGYDPDDGRMDELIVLNPPSYTGKPMPVVSGSVTPSPVTPASAGLFSSSGSYPVASSSQTLDGAGNRRYADGAYFDANAVNVYSTISGAGSLSYDGDSNLKSDGTRSFDWDAENRLTNVVPTTVTNGAYKVAYRYDHQQRMRQRIVSRWNGSSWQAQYTDTFTFDGWEPVCQVRVGVSGVVTNHYLWGLDLAGQRSGRTGQSAGGIGGLLAIRVEGAGAPRIYLPVADQVGSIRSVINAATLAVVAWFSYTPYGQVQQSWYADAQTRADLECASIRFQSKWQDQETGLVNFGYRWYHPTLGKWTVRDPLAESGGVNLTLAFGADPINNIDPDGLVYTRTYSADGNTCISRNELGDTLIFKLNNGQWIKTYQGNGIDTDKSVVNAVLWGASEGSLIFFNELSFGFTPLDDAANQYQGAEYQAARFAARVSRTALITAGTAGTMGVLGGAAANGSTAAQVTLKVAQVGFTAAAANSAGQNLGEATVEWQTGEYWAAGLHTTLGAIDVWSAYSGGKGLAKDATGFVNSRLAAKRGYRAVSDAELKDIGEHGFRPHPEGRSMNDKWFSETREGAGAFKEKFPDLKHVVEAEVPKDVFEKSFKHPNIDGTGPGFAVPPELQPRLKPR